jgi:hypothetical protein
LVRGFDGVRRIVIIRRRTASPPHEVQKHGNERHGRKHGNRFAAMARQELARALT